MYSPSLVIARHTLGIPFWKLDTLKTPSFLFLARHVIGLSVLDVGSGGGVRDGSPKEGDHRIIMAVLHEQFTVIGNNLYGLVQK